MTLSDQNDAEWLELIASAREGSDEALSQIVAQTRNYLLAIANSRLDPGLAAKFDASDIVQVSLIEAQNSMPAFAGTTEAEMRVWLKRIVINNLIDHARRYTHTQSRSIAKEVLLDGNGSKFQAATTTASSIALKRETDAQLLNAVSRLTPRQRYVVQARTRHGFKFQRIAVQLKISESAARKLWERALVRLESLLEDANV